MAVGLVVVCHSATLARGVVEVGQAMSTAELGLAIAAGVDGPGDVLGTDALQVVRAIEEVWSDDGVLVLMDVGSAVLAAELALDMLSPERAARVRLSAAPLVEGLLAAAVQAAAHSDLGTVAQAALEGLSAKRAHLREGPIAPAEPLANDSDEHAVELEVRVDLPHGLHARPAARIVSTVNAFDATVTVTNRTSCRGPAAATSLNAIMALGVAPGHDVVFRISGPQSAEAEAALRVLADGDFDDPALAAEGTNTHARPPHASAAIDNGTGEGPDGELPGLPGSPGIGIGSIRWMGGSEPAPADEPAESSEVAVDRLRTALAAVDESFRVTVQAAPNRDVAEIIETQRMLVSDATLITAAEDRVENLGQGATAAWLGAIAAATDSLRESGDGYLMARIEDLDAIGRAVVDELAGATRTNDELWGVVAATQLSPTQAARLDPKLVDGVVTVEGSPSAHSAIVLRSLGIPAVVGLGKRLVDVEAGTSVIVDGNAGRIIVDPDESALREAVADSERASSVRTDALTRASLPASTRDGEAVQVRANVGSIAEAESAHAHGADGAGLVRTELLFLDRTTPPSEDEQAVHYSHICAALPNRPIVFRTLDVGGDKHVPYLPVSEETNPYLGNRGVRLALSNPALLVDQLRSMLRTAARYPVQIMLPMVTVLDEVTAVHRLLEAERDALVASGVPAPKRVPLGVMIETPALALRIASVLPIVDFVSIGTNDLVQYTTAAERGNVAVDHLYDALDPGVLRLIADVTQRARAMQVPVSLCGAAAEDPLALVILVGLGIRDFSLAPTLVPEMKERVRQIDTAHAREVAERALIAPSAEAVRELLEGTRPAAGYTG